MLERFNFKKLPLKILYSIFVYPFVYLWFMTIFIFIVSIPLSITIVPYLVSYNWDAFSWGTVEIVTIVLSVLSISFFLYYGFKVALYFIKIPRYYKYKHFKIFEPTEKKLEKVKNLKIFPPVSNYFEATLFYCSLFSIEITILLALLVNYF